MPDTVAEVVAGLDLLDHHCHGVVLHAPTDAEYEDLISESSRPPAPGTSRWDTPVGLAVRRSCAPLLDLPPFAAPTAYLARRRELGAEEVSRRLLRAAGTRGLVLDTGFRADEIADPAAMAALAGGPTWEVVRLEAVAEDVARAGVSAGAYPDAFAHMLANRAEGAVGLKTILAYRSGFAVDPSPPTRAEVVSAAGHWLRARETGPARLADPVLLRYGIWTAAELARGCRLPLQVHAGYGDPDLTLHLANPSLLTELLRRLDSMGVEVVLLHCYPYHREAAYLADMYPHVSFDLGLALTFAGAGAARILAEALEIAPFTKLLYSSDGFGAAELHLLGALHFRVALTAVLDGWLADGACDRATAERIARLAAHENAERLYRLP